MLGSGTTRCTGIHVSDDSVYAVELLRRRDRVSMGPCAVIPLAEPLSLPEGLADDGQRERLARALADLPVLGIEGKRPYFALAGTATFVKRHPLPPGGDAESREQLLWEARQLLGEDCDEYVVDILRTRRHAFLIAARQQILDLYGVLSRQAGLGAPGFDMFPFALCNALEGSGAVSGRGAELIVYGDTVSGRAVLLRDGEFEAEAVWTVAAGTEQEDGLARLCGSELDEDERLDRAWLCGAAAADSPLLARRADAIAELDPFAGLPRTAAAEEALAHSHRSESAFGVAAGLAYRAAAEA